MAVPASAKRLLDFIASYEAPGGYDVVFGNRQDRMPKPLTSMTIAEAIADGPRRARDRGRDGRKGSSAAGRYQFMQATLQDLVEAGTANPSARLSPEEQDRLGYALLLGRGFDRFMAGSMSQTEFGNRLAMEWASFPVLSPVNGKRRGQSYYAGDGQNHALVSPQAVESVLASLRQAAPAIAAPVAPTVPAAEVHAPWWQRLFVGKPKPVAAKARPGLHPNGSPELWDVQAAMKDRGYYTSGLLDGLDGGKTQAAVAQIRKDNGLGDGGVDAQFLAGLPTWPARAVSKERANMTLGAAEQHAPELFGPAKWLVSAGLGSLGLGGAAGTGLMDGVQSGVTKANDVFGQVQSAFALISGVFAFVVEHKTLFFCIGGLILVFKGFAFMADGWYKIRRAFF